MTAHRENYVTTPWKKCILCAFCFHSKGPKDPSALLAELLTRQVPSLAQVMNGVVISADDPASSLFLSNCTFEGSFSSDTGERRGLGGAVYANGSLSIENSTFSDNFFAFDDINTPSPVAGSSSQSTNNLVSCGIECANPGNCMLDALGLGN